MVYDCEPDEDSFRIGPGPSGTRRLMSVQRLMKWIFVLGCGLGLLVNLGHLLDAMLSGGVPRRAICVNNLKMISLALYSYHERFGSFPPAYIPDASGRPMHSWRVLILPFLDEQPLYDQYDFGEPWNGPNNIKVLNSMPRFFACPHRSPNPKKRTSYVVITGPGTLFPGASSVKVVDISDGTPNTLMVVETDNVDIPWTSPIDLDVRSMSLQINDRKAPGISSQHPRGANVSYVDGTVRWLGEKISDEEALRALITIAGGEGIVDEDALHPK
jgi:prepilin-type processing-associated H-X9-DG protein